MPHRATGACPSTLKLEGRSGCRIMAIPQLSKLKPGVRFPSPAPQVAEVNTNIYDVSRKLPPMTIDRQLNELFITLTESVEAFIHEVKNKRSDLMATDEWTVKDELCHIVFWHENYAANYKALAEHKDPPLPEGMSTINMRGVASLRRRSIKELIARFYLANLSLRKSIIKNKVPRMTYSKGGRTYETADFLEMIARHINTHTKQVKKAN